MKAAARDGLAALHRRARPVRARVALACALWLGSASIGCESAEEKCGKVRDAAASAWNEYVATLEKARARAALGASEAHDKLTREVELRLSPGAQKVADGKYDRSSEAWGRAHAIALNDACAKDSECRTLKRKNADAQASMTDLDERLPLARAAQAAARGAADEAAKAAAATLVHPEYPQLRQARELTAQAVKLCEDVPPQDHGAIVPGAR